MPTITVEGGRVLSGTLGVRGAKNAVLKEMVAALLAPGRHRLTNVPRILDVDLMADVLRHSGCVVEFGDHELWTEVPDQVRSEEHTSELQSRPHLLCRLLLEKKKKHQND